MSTLCAAEYARTGGGADVASAAAAISFGVPTPAALAPAPAAPAAPASPLSGPVWEPTPALLVPGRIMQPLPSSGMGRAAPGVQGKGGTAVSAHAATNMGVVASPGGGKENPWHRWPRRVRSAAKLRKRYVAPGGESLRMGAGSRRS